MLCVVYLSVCLSLTLCVVLWLVSGVRIITVVSYIVLRWDLRPATEWEPSPEVGFCRTPTSIHLLCDSTAKGIDCCGYD